MNFYLKLFIPLLFTLNLTTNVNCQSTQTMDQNRKMVQEVDGLQNIKQKGVLTVLSPNEQPYSYKDPKSGAFNGIDADIIKEVAKRLGAKDVSVKYIAFPNAIEELISNPEIDILGQGIYVTDEREKVVNFTNPIYTEKDAILTRQNSGINSKDELKNKTIGVIGNTVYESMAKNWKQQGMLKDYIKFFDYNSLQISLESGMVDGILVDSIIAENSIIMKPKAKFKILSPSQYKSELDLNVGYAIKKGDTDLLNAINEKLQDMRKDGSLYEILAKYGLIGHYIP